MSNNSAIEWPEPFAIENCIAWNFQAGIQARRDSKNPNLVVPGSMAKFVIGENRKVVLRCMTREEYQSVRVADALRYDRNINSLRERF